MKGNARYAANFVNVLVDVMFLIEVLADVLVDYVSYAASRPIFAAFTLTKSLTGRMGARCRSKIARWPVAVAIRPDME